MHASLGLRMASRLKSGFRTLPQTIRAESTECFAL